ncbi:MAG: class I SAM-dependent methyltransferase [Bacteroidota bacterium]|nr:class I SAM-dependent methyltransferase [Bacteroidota bacterium]
MNSTSLQCPVCNLNRLSPKPFGYNFNQKWLGAYECLQCGVIFIHPQPTKEELKQLYSKKYFEGDFRCGHAGSYFDDKTIDELNDYKFLEKIKHYKSNGKLLEIGCAGGIFLNAARREGYEVYGVEYSNDAAELARNKFKLNVVTGELKEGMYQSDIFDVVFMGDVIEHLSDPLNTLKIINSTLKVSGILVIVCPMQTNTIFSRLGFMLYKIIQKKATVHLPPYHLFEYRPKSLSWLFQIAGFKIIKVDQSTIRPDKISLRGPIYQRVFKKVFQYPNFAVTKVFNLFGDRIEIFAVKEN